MGKNNEPVLRDNVQERVSGRNRYSFLWVAQIKAKVKLLLSSIYREFDCFLSANLLDIF